MGRPFSARAAFAATLALLTACQSILGFEDFEEASGAAAGNGGGDAGRAGTENTGGASGKAGSDTGGKSGASGAATAGNAGDPGTGGGDQGAVGEACGAEGTCGGGLTCLYGYCRPECEDDTDCAQGSVCLFRTATGGGCRLAAETCDGDCVNADLVCGIDDTCRIACSDEDSCDSSTQRCIAGTCVSTVGEGADEWDCGGAADGELTCDGRALAVCNVIEPGLSSIDSCPSVAHCEASLPQDLDYDPENPPECSAGCVADQPYCEGATLLTCNDQGSGPVDAGEDCATDGLCEASVDAESDGCIAPSCEEDEVRCSGGETELTLQRCDEDRTGFSNEAFCGDATPQCNPGASACFALDIDPNEVSMEEYELWLQTGPSTAGQATGCEWNGSFALDPTCALTVSECTGAGCTQPVVCVDWCDAAAYCTAAGRRLCGRVGGGMTPFDRATEPGTSQWMNACSAGGQFEWGGGASPQPGNEECWYAGTSDGETYPVGSHDDCRSPSPGYADLMDLSGNAEEWEDSCELIVTSEEAGPDDACRTRGGSIASQTAAEIRCDALPASARPRNFYGSTLGFRCCG